MLFEAIMKTKIERELIDSTILKLVAESSLTAAIDLLEATHKKEDPEAIEQAINRNRYENNPMSLPSYSYSPLLIQSFFVKQTEFGKPVKHYSNAFFSNLASVHYFHTYLSGILTLGFHGGVGKQLLATEKKQFKTHCDAGGLYQLNNNKE